MHPCWHGNPRTVFERRHREEQLCGQFNPSLCFSQQIKVTHCCLSCDLQVELAIHQGNYGAWKTVASGLSP